MTDAGTDRLIADVRDQKSEGQNPGKPGQKTVRVIVAPWIDPGGNPWLFPPTRYELPLYLATVTVSATIVAVGVITIVRWVLRRYP